MVTSVRRRPTGEIEKPKCASCAREMWLMRIEPRLSSDSCTFECARCGETKQLEVAPGRGLGKPLSAS